MHRVPIFDIDAGESIWVFEYTAGVDQALALGGYICEVWGRKLGFQVAHGCICGNSDHELLVVGSFHVEGELRLLGRGGLVSHSEARDG
jgi:hypothetical protein